MVGRSPCNSGPGTYSLYPHAFQFLFQGVLQDWPELLQQGGVSPQSSQHLLLSISGVLQICSTRQSTKVSLGAQNLHSQSPTAPAWPSLARDPGFWPASPGPWAPPESPSQMLGCFCCWLPLLQTTDLPAGSSSPAGPGPPRSGLRAAQVSSRLSGF